MTVSKNFFVNKFVSSNYSRPLYNPVIPYPVVVVPEVCYPPSDLEIITPDAQLALERIETHYGRNIFDKTYELIPNDYNEYINLYNIVHDLMQVITNQKLLLLLRIALDTLKGAINSYYLYGMNISLIFDKATLQNTINTILSGKNDHTVSVATGQISITRKLKLSNVFNCYILIFGMPAAGVGFDPIKIKYLVDILQLNGIDPYS